MLPNVLILDTHALVAKMRDMSRDPALPGDVVRAPHFIDDILMVLVECVHERAGAEQRIEELAGEIQAGVCHSGPGYVPRLYAPHVRELGLEILSQLDSLSAYAGYRALPFHYHLFPDITANLDVTLMRTHELTHARHSLHSGRSTPGVSPGSV